MARAQAQQVRQGHILLNPIKIIPKSATVRPAQRPGEVVIATGESGREHVFKSQRVSIYQEGSDLFIEVDGDDPVYLEHPEHGHIAVLPGNYKLIEQIEHDDIGFGQQTRRSYD